MLLRSLLLNGSALALPLFEGESTGGPPATPPGSTPPAAIAAPWGADVSKPWMLGDAAAPKPWFETLADGPTKEFVRSKNYGNPAVMADALYSATRMVNGNAVELPSIDGDAKAWEPFNAKMRGDSIKAPTDYKFDFGKDDKGAAIEGDPRMIKFAQELAFNLGIHPKRAQELVVNPWQQFAAEMNAASVQEANAKNEQEANAVRTKWGANFESLRAGGERVAKSLKLDPATLTAIEAHIGAAPLMDLFAQLGKLSAEGGMIGGAGGNSTDPVNMTPEQVQQKINEKMADAQFQTAYRDRQNPGHARAVEEMEALHKLLSAKKQQA